MAFDDFTWTATLTGNVIAECWGAGGGGRIGQNFPLAGGGGGGAAYARKAAIAVTNGVGYLARVARASAMNTNGDNSLFINGATCLARGGFGAAFGGFGAGGAAGTSVGDVKFSGGDGGGPPLSISEAGYGGGSSADDANTGNFGGHPTKGTGWPRGGEGGSGGAINVSGTDGLTPGGGGGGGGSAVVQTNGGIGGQGAVVIWEDLGVWPPCGQIPLAQYGSPPPYFWAACFNGRCYAFLM